MAPRTKALLLLCFALSLWAPCVDSEGAGAAGLPQADGGSVEETPPRPAQEEEKPVLHQGIPIIEVDAEQAARLQEAIALTANSPTAGQQLAAFLETELARVLEESSDLGADADLSGASDSEAGVVGAEEPLDEALEAALTDAFNVRYGPKLDGVENADVWKAWELYETLARDNNSQEARFAMGEMLLMGSHGPVDAAAGLEWLNVSLAEGFMHAKYVWALLHATGIGLNASEPSLPAVQDEALSVLYLYLAAVEDLHQASLALGYRHLMGYGVPKSCHVAVSYYETVAQLVVDQHESGYFVQIEALRLADLDQTDATGPREDDEEVVEYYRQLADDGDGYAAAAVGRVLYFGGRGVEPDPAAAVQYFERAIDQNYAPAVAHLAHMHLQGQAGAASSNATAFKLYQKGAAAGDTDAMNGLAFMYLHGVGDTEPNGKQALSWFKKAAARGNPDAHFHLGTMYYDGQGVKASLHAALRHFHEAAAGGHVRAMYNAGHMHLAGEGTMRSCVMAVKLFKMVAERGPWAERMYRGRALYQAGRLEEAFWTYVKCAEEGLVVAQLNAGWMLDQGGLDEALVGGRQRQLRLAYRYFQMAAAQNEPSAERTLGDYRYYKVLEPDREEGGDEEPVALPAAAAEGEGGAEAAAGPSATPPAPAEAAQATSAGGSGAATAAGASRAPDAPEAASRHPQHLAQAAKHYRRAADAGDAEAYFNLAWMHQHGIGLDQDYHLAKRFYDHALAESTDALVPVTLALWSLRVQVTWDLLLGREDPAALAEAAAAAGGGSQQGSNPQQQRGPLSFVWFKLTRGLSTYAFVENAVLVIAVVSLVAALLVRQLTDRPWWT